MRKGNTGTLADCLVAWFPPPDGLEVEALAAAAYIAEVLHSVGSANKPRRQFRKGK